MKKFKLIVDNKVVNVSDLPEREQRIYESGYNRGHNLGFCKGQIAAFCLVLFAMLLIQLRH